MQNPSPHRSFRKLALTVGLIALGGTLVAGPIPGKWAFPDGGKKISQRPAGMNWAIIKNNGPESILVTSKGLSTTASAVILPDGVTYSFSVPANAKNCVIRDEVSGTGAGAKGILFWAKQGQGNSIGDPSGNQ